MPIIKGTIDIPEAINYDAEEFYEKLMAQEQKQQNQQSKQQGQSEKSESGQGENESQSGQNSHSMWEDAVKRAEEEKKNSQNKKQDEKQQEIEKAKISEKQTFENNEKAKIKRAEEIMSKLNSTRRGMGGESQEVVIGNVGKAGKAVVNWKKVLIRNLEIEDEHWGHKFSDKSNGYAARIEDIEYDEKAETEIILDTSGSVSVDLLKSFLRQVKTALKNSTIKVGTFSNDFHGWTEIKRESDIDNLKIRVGGGTNFDSASKAFTKRKDVNKICFTDGEDCGDAGIKDKRKGILWISFENSHFKPDNGKVIFVHPNLINLEKEIKNKKGICKDTYLQDK
ncbi:MAG: VWA domain-containing protein [Clostridia bacterium]|nr:VWA domain-containing protein [Clostridia bacterium]